MALAPVPAVATVLPGLALAAGLVTAGGLLLGVAATRAAPPAAEGAPPCPGPGGGLTPAQRAAKRAFDVAGAAVLVACLAPVLLACAVAVRLSGPGPWLFRQERVGEGGRVFRMRKFRSMTTDAEQRLELLRPRNDADGPLFKLVDDPRVTGVGRFLRAWSLDELPQLLDVLRGDMSLVGPRPLPVYEVDLDDPWARARLRVKPGVTGLWQVSGRHRLRFEDLVRYDLAYVENWSLALDVLVLLRTIPAVLRRSGV